jgi:hypothetical protein
MEPLATFVIDEMIRNGKLYQTHARLDQDSHSGDFSNQLPDRSMGEEDRVWQDDRN